MSEFLSLANDEWSPVDPYIGGDDKFPIARGAAQCLLELPRLGNESITRAFEIAQDTRDPEVRRLLFHLVAKTGAPHHREALLKLAINDSTKPAIAEQAASALRTCAMEGALGANLVIQPDQLLELPPGVAAELVVVAGLCGPERLVDDLASRLAGRKGRRVFLILLAVAVSHSFPDLQEKIINLLPPGHPALPLITDPNPPKLKRHSLDDLGDPLAVREVLWLLTDYFE